MNFHILTLFPEMVMQGLNTSITGRAVQQNKIGIEAVNIRDFSRDKHGRVDDYTYGGGAGMLMQAQPVYDAYQSVAEKLSPEARKRVIYVTPQGTPFTQSMAQELAESDELVLLCGHYEGIDERVLEEIVTDYVSIGDYVLTGGELAAMVIVDAVARLVPSVLHNEESAQTESFHGNLLEYPQYSRPVEWHGKKVPEVLLSGNQKNIDAWRNREAVKRTRERRPDLYERYQELSACKEILMQKKLHHMDMIELINRGRAILVGRQDHGEKGTEILLMDGESHVFFHTWIGNDRKADESAADWQSAETILRRMDGLCKYPVEVLSLHQREFVPVAEELGYGLDMECLQAVYTRREKLPITGLYRTDGGVLENGISIRPLTMEYLDTACAVYHTVDDPEYMRGRIAKGAMYGAFIDGQLAGFMGVHDEGSIGLLEVLPEYRRRHVAMALETYVFNRFIEQGMIPYGQIVVGNEASGRLQEKMGVCFAKEHVFWLSKLRDWSLEEATSAHVGRGL